MGECFNHFFSDISIVKALKRKIPLLLYLIRINNKYSDVVFELKDKSILVNGDCKQFIDNLNNK